MTEKVVCPSCGIEVPPGASFCPREGIPLTTSEPPEDEGTVTRDPLLNTSVGEYKIVRRLGEGGMGLVYEGVQPLIGKRVAIKVLLPELAGDPEWSARFVAEARAVNAIRHRGIVDVFGFNALADGRQCLVMELLEGEPLDYLLNSRGRLPASEVLPLLQDAFEALDAAHGAGVIHRDLKPSNLFVVRPTRGAPYVKILDFGLAKQGLPDATTAQTRVSRVVGTPCYMAPEQGRGQPVSPRTDLYAMGVVMFELLSGRLPFEGATAYELLAQHLERQPPRLRERVPDVPAALDELVDRLLQKDPEARPASAGEVSGELARLRRRLEPRSTQVSAVGARPRPQQLTGRRVPSPASETTEPGEPAERPARWAPCTEVIDRGERAAPPPRTERTGLRRSKTLLVGGAVAGVALLGLLWLLTRGDDIPQPAAVSLPTAALPRPGPAARPDAPAALRSPEPEPAVEAAAEPAAAPARREPEVASSRAERRSPATPPKRTQAAEPLVDAPAAPLLSAPSLSKRIDGLEARLRIPGVPPSRTALALLATARENLAAAQTQQQLSAVETFLDDWESRFLPSP